jgi:hypothetical protein
MPCRPQSLIIKITENVIATGVPFTPKKINICKRLFLQEKISFGVLA